jgi:hypothetical protein
MKVKITNKLGKVEKIDDAESCKVMEITTAVKLKEGNLRILSTSGIKSVEIKI